jgi:hypothetical protein
MKGALQGEAWRIGLPRRLSGHDRHARAFLRRYPLRASPRLTEESRRCPRPCSPNFSGLGHSLSSTAGLIEMMRRPAAQATVERCVRRRAAHFFPWTPGISSGAPRALEPGRFRSRSAINPRKWRLRRPHHVLLSRFNLRRQLSF